MIEMFTCIDCHKKKYFIYEDSRCKKCFLLNQEQEDKYPEDVYQISEDLNLTLEEALTYYINNKPSYHSLTNR